MNTLRIRGRDYTVEPYERTTALGKKETGYRFIGKRGAQYFTMRNHKTPSLLFVVSYALSSDAMRGVWLDDSNGLKVIEE